MPPNKYKKTPEPAGGFRGLVATLRLYQASTLRFAAQPDSLQTLSGRATDASTQCIWLEWHTIVHSAYDIRRRGSCQAASARLYRRAGGHITVRFDRSRWTDVAVMMHNAPVPALL